MNELPTIVQSSANLKGDSDSSSTTKTVPNFRPQVPVLTVAVPYVNCEYDHWDYSTQTHPYIRFDAGRLTREEWETINAIRNGYMLRGDTDKHGKKINTPIAAFRMLLAEVRQSLRKMDITESD